MLTVFAIIGVFFTVAFIVFSINNSQSNPSTNYHRNQQFVTKANSGVELCTFLIIFTDKAIQKDIQLKNLTPTARTFRLLRVIGECEKKRLAAKKSLAFQFNLPVSEVEKYINSCFKKIAKEYIKK